MRLLDCWMHDLSKANLEFQYLTQQYSLIMYILISIQKESTLKKTMFHIYHLYRIDKIGISHCCVQTFENRIEIKTA